MWITLEMEVFLLRGREDISRKILLRNSKVIYLWSLHFLLYLYKEVMYHMWTVKGCHHKFVRIVLIKVTKIWAERQAGGWKEKVSILTLLIWAFSWKKVKAFLSLCDTMVVFFNWCVKLPLHIPAHPPLIWCM